MSLDGFIAGPKGEFDWIVMDPEIDFQSIYNQFDTIIMGRRTFEPMMSADNVEMTTDMFRNMKIFVFSRTLSASDYPDVTIVADRFDETIHALREENGKDIWLFGGGRLFKSLAEAGHVDTVEVAIIPILLGGGIPLFPPPSPPVNLKLSRHIVYPQTGTVGLEYAVVK